MNCTVQAAYRRQYLKEMWNERTRNTQNYWLPAVNFNYLFGAKTTLQEMRRICQVLGDL